MLDRQARNGAKVIRSTFGFIDTKGKPNELVFFLSFFFFLNSLVVAEKPTFCSDLSHQLGRPAPTGYSMDSNWENTRTRVCSDPCNRQRPIPRKNSGTLFCPLKILGHPMSSFCVTTLHFSVFKIKHLPMFNHHFLFMERTANSQDSPWVKGLTRIHTWGPLPSGWMERGICDFCAGKPA